jgi:uncharacterized protein YidB (DUF937 family)
MRVGELLDGLVEDGLLHEEARAGAADVALVEVDALDDAFDGLVDAGVLEDDVGGLAAEFEREALAGARDGLGDALADLGGAGEGDLVDAGVVDEGRAGAPVAGDDVDDAGGRPTSSKISARRSAVRAWSRRA